MKRLVVAVLVLGAAAGSGYWYYRYTQKPAAPTVATSAVTRGDVVETVGATGTLQAVTTVQVGSQVSGNIAYLGADFNSLVRKGQVLARLDPSMFDAQAQQSRASLAQARANLLRAQSDLERTRVQLADAQQKYDRAKALSARGLLPQSDLDAAKTTVDTSQAAVQSQQATVTQTQAAVTQAEAGVNQSQVNLEHTVIQAPIDGLVISRNVDVGQTVAASMQAPTLFVLAADLTKMQVVANLDESDVGRIRPNQSVTFRVDAYPSDTFRGTVSQVRLEPKIQQNVVTYATVIDVPNNDLRLKPGMTANVNVEIARASNVLRVPNSALRFRPSNEAFAAFGQTPPAGRGGGPGGNRRRDAAPVAQNAPTAPALSGDARTGTVASPSAAPSGTAGSVPGPGPQAGRRSADAPGDRTTDAGARPDSGSSGRGPNSADAGAGIGGQGSGAAPSQEEQRSRFAERMQNLSPEEREARLARMRERGFDPSNPGAGFGGRGGGPGAFSQAGDANAARGGRTGGDASRRSAGSPQQAASSMAGGATTIDALFAPLPRTESRGSVWLFVENQLRMVPLRLGISDGQNTELVEGALTEGTEVITNVTIAGQSTRPAANAFPGFGQPGRGGFGGGGNRGGGPGR